MLLIDVPPSTDPALNLAMEELCLLELPTGPAYFLLYVNRPSIVIGKHQNAVAEINTDIVEERGIPVLRRFSGGGAVYHDQGNLNFSFIRRYEPRYFNNYGLSTGLVAKALQQMGVPAELNARGDILVNGAKVSGNAQAVRRDRMVSHGTLLFRSQLDAIGPAIHPKPGTFSSHARPSVRSSVANIGDHLPPSMDMEGFKTALLGHLFPDAQLLVPVPLDHGFLPRAQALADEKYRSWEWNFGRSPDFGLRRAQQLGNLLVELQLHVAKGRVAQVSLEGTFRDPGHVRYLERALKGVRYRRDELRAAITHAKADELLEGTRADDLLKLLH